jgi:hypothetical protein
MMSATSWVGNDLKDLLVFDGTIEVHGSDSGVGFTNALARGLRHYTWKYPFEVA